MSPLLAAMDVDDAIGLIFVLIAFISWIVNAISGKAAKRPPAPARPRPPVRPNPDPLHQEINIFIQDLLPDKPGAGAGRGKNQGRPAAENQPRGKSKSRRNQPAGAPVKPPAAAMPATSASASRSSRPGGKVSNRQSPGSGNVGTGIRSPIEAEAKEPRVQAQVARDLKDRIHSGVAQHLGVFSGAPAETATPASPTIAQSVAAMLRTPASVQQAILLQTILSAPPGMRGTRNT